MMKTGKRGLSLFLALLMLVSAIPAGGLIVHADDSPYQVGDVISFGSYPQREVKSEAVIAELEALEKDWQDYRRDVGMQYADFDYNGSRYRAVRIDRSVNYFQRDCGFLPGTTHYFVYQQIKWQVLDPENGYVLCSKILDASTFADSSFQYETDDPSEQIQYKSNYESSFIRDWLSNDFYQTAFTPLEQEQLHAALIPHSGGLVGSNNSTIDTVFLPTRQVMANAAYGYNTSETTGDATRRAAETDYAACMGLCCRFPSNLSWNDHSPYYPYLNAYMLGTPFTTNTVYFVDCNARVYADSNTNCETTMLGVRPMTALRLSEGFPETEATKVDDYDFGEEVTFGSYPQSRVTDSALIASLDAVEKDWQDAGQYFAEQFCDFDYEGERYRALKYGTNFNAWTANPSTGVFQRTAFSAGTTVYFKYEPLKWIVFDPDQKLLYCAKSIDCRLFSSADGVAYADSLVRDYLNNEFYHTAFNGSEQTRVDPSEIVSYNTNAELISTTDYLFLPSLADVKNNADFFDTHHGATDYALAQDSTVFNGVTYQWFHQFYLRDSSCSQTLWTYAPHGEIHDVSQIPPEIPVYSPSFLYHYTRLRSGYLEKDSFLTAQAQGVQPMIRLKNAFNLCTHAYESVVTREPTCARIGIRSYCCLYCHDVYHEAIAKTPHDLKHYEIQKTCSRDGLSFDCCTMCKRVFNRMVDPSAGHQYVDGVCTVCGERQEWLYTEADGNITITGYSGSDQSVTVPHVLAGKTVTAIGRSAFENNETVTYVKLPDTIKTIGERAFRGCTALQEVFVGDGLLSLETNAFASCGSLVTVCITSRNAEIKQAFSGNDPRLLIIAPITSNTENSVKQSHLPCSVFWRFLGRDNLCSLYVSGEITMYQDLDYHYWRELAEKYEDACYFYFDKIIFEGIYRQDVDPALIGGADESELFLALENVCIGTRIKGELLSFHEFEECLSGRQSGLEMFVVDKNEEEHSAAIRFEALLRLVLNVLSRAINRLVSVFKKK